MHCIFIPLYRIICLICWVKFSDSGWWLDDLIGIFLKLWILGIFTFLAIIFFVFVILFVILKKGNNSWLRSSLLIMQKPTVIFLIIKYDNILFNYREIPLFVLLRGLPSFLNIKFDVFQKIHTEIWVRTDTHCEVVDSFLVGSCELEFHLFLGDQGGQVVGRGDEGVGLAVRDVHPPQLTHVIFLVFNLYQLTKTPVCRPWSKDSGHCGTHGTFQRVPFLFCSYPFGTWSIDISVAFR